MIWATTWQDALPSRSSRSNPQFTGFRTDFLSSEKGGRPAPQAFLVEQVPNWVLPVHFHHVHQFQLVTAGRGTIGRRPLAPFAVHFTTPESAYGPITSGPKGLSYLTLRATPDEGAWYMPESRPRMQKGLPKYQMTAEAPVVSDENSLRERHEPAIEQLIAPNMEGAAAWLLRLPANHRVDLPRAPKSGGAYCVVATGSMVATNREYGPVSAIFAAAEEEFGIAAGKQGLEVVVMQFPAKALGG